MNDRGQDPLRDETYFTVPFNNQPYAVIGRPYSVHSLLTSPLAHGCHDPGDLIR